MLSLKLLAHCAIFCSMLEFTLSYEAPFAVLTEFAFATTLSKHSLATLSLEKVACKSRAFA